MAYIDEHRDRFGVEPICRTLAAAGVKIAPSTYYATKVPPPSARALRDAVMMPILLALSTANYRVYGAHKLWKAARRAGHEIGRDQVARLMRQRLSEWSAVRRIAGRADEGLRCSPFCPTRREPRQPVRGLGMMGQKGCLSNRFVHGFGVRVAHGVGQQNRR